MAHDRTDVWLVEKAPRVRSDTEQLLPELHRLLEITDSHADVMESLGGATGRRVVGLHRGCHGPPIRG